METSASFEARSAPWSHPPVSSARTDPRGGAASNVRPYRDPFSSRAYALEGDLHAGVGRVDTIRGYERIPIGRPRGLAFVVLSRYECFPRGILNTRRDQNHQ
jgi:hypothetical protein